MGRGIVPSDVDRSGRMLVQEGLQYFGDLSAAFVEPEEDDRFSRVLVHRPEARVFVGLAWGGNHHLLSFRAPHGTQGGKPAQITRIR